MRNWHFSRHASPLMTLVTGLCVLLALAAFTLAATSAPATAETGPEPAKFALSNDEMIVSGTVVGIGDGLIGVQEANGAAPVAFPVVSRATMSRAGEPVALNELRQHEPVHLTIDRNTGVVLQIVADPSPGLMFQPSNEMAAFALLGLIAGAFALTLLHWTRTGTVSAGDEGLGRRARRLGLALKPALAKQEANYQA
jgi:H+/Cl- antiporter ClcA